MDLKNIHIGELIKYRLEELNMSQDRVCSFMRCEEDDIKEMLNNKSIEADVLLRWSKLLEYDFFRIYSQHLILFAPQASIGYKQEKEKTSKMPVFRKNVYTKEIIDYLLMLIHTKEKTPGEIIKEYKIPKTTLYKWIKKYPVKTI